MVKTYKLKHNNKLLGIGTKIFATGNFNIFQILPKCWAPGLWAGCKGLKITINSSNKEVEVSAIDLNHGLIVVKI